VQAVKAGKLEDRYENPLGALLNQEAQARAGTNGRETARYRQRRQPDGCAGTSLNVVGKGGGQKAKFRGARRMSALASTKADIALDGCGRSRTANACSRGNDAGVARRKTNSRVQSIKGEVLGAAKAETRRIKADEHYLDGCGASAPLSRLKARGRLQLKHSNVRD
jgi:hypothetical protein